MIYDYANVFTSSVVCLFFVWDCNAASWICLTVCLCVCVCVRVHACVCEMHYLRQYGYITPVEIDYLKWGLPGKHPPPTVDFRFWAVLCTAHSSCPPYLPLTNWQTWNPPSEGPCWAALCRRLGECFLQTCRFTSKVHILFDTILPFLGKHIPF